MNLYFLVEGRRTEPQIYRRWLKHALPELREVRHAGELSGDGYRLRSAGGYPQILDRIRGSVEEVQAAGVRLDEFFVCLDAEDESYHDRYSRVAVFLQELSPPFRFTVIVQNCCIETWLLGDRSLLRPPPKTRELRTMRAHYDVGRDDPEKMPTMDGYGTRARFHLAYLKAVIQDRNAGRSTERIRYTKSSVAYFGELPHFLALMSRSDETGHLASFAHLLSAWRALGASI